MSYWNRPFFPEHCGDATLDDSETYDTMTRIAGTFAGIARSFKAVADHYGWTHIVLVSEDNAGSRSGSRAICWYGAQPFDDVFGHNENYTFAWFILGSHPTDEQLDDVLQQIRSRTRGLPTPCAIFHLHLATCNPNTMYILSVCIRLLCDIYYLVKSMLVRWCWYVSVEMIHTPMIQCS